MAKAQGRDTPVMRQFLAAKAAHPDALVFFRLGDFYELFFDDAVVAAKALDLTLTSRNKNSDDAIPMAGVPAHAASSYVQRLLEQGFRVAICEQMADPATVKGIVPREVVRVVTPAFAFDDQGVDARRNSFVVGLEWDAVDSVYGVGVLDLSTGELMACQAEDDEAALAEIVRLDPRELLVGAEARELSNELRGLLPRAALREEEREPDEAALEAVVGKGEAERACPSRAARRAAARCVELARVCEPGRALPITRLVAYQLGDALALDEAAQRHLELVRTLDGDAKGALLHHIDETRTAAGARLLRRRLLAPLTTVADIRRRLDGVELFVTQPGLRAEVRARLDGVADLERLAVKLAVDRAAPRDVGKLRATLAELPALARVLGECKDPGAREALGVPAGDPWLDVCDDVHALLCGALADELPLRAAEGGAIRDGHDAELDDARSLTRDGQRHIVELETRLRESTQIGSLKLRYTRVFGWYVEVTKSHIAKVPKAWRRKQTIATGERYTCDELDALAERLARAEDRASSREAELWAELVSALARHVERFKAVAARLAAWDVASALAETAHKYDFVRPEVDDSLELELEESRHPVVERLAAAGRFVPNDAHLDAALDAPEDRSALWIVTGPNMAGKSTFMRQIALIVIMAQMGSFVPARRAKVGVVDRVLTRVGASDNLARGESTFMVEMKETAGILRRATRRSLVVLDEIGRGTSTFDGLSIAWAVAEHLHDVIGCRALFATHYHELTQLAATCARAENHSVSAREHQGGIVFLHAVQRGAASRSYGVACAKLAGLPEPVLARARVLLEDLEKGGSAKRAGKRAPQLDLFSARPSEPPQAEAHPALRALAAVDVDRMTPLDALTMLAALKKQVTEA